MKRPVFILGAGGHAKVLIDCLRLQHHEIAGMTTPDTSLHGKFFCGVRVLGTDAELQNLERNKVELVNGLGSIQYDSGRQRLFDSLKQQGFSFARVVHPSAIIASDVQLGEGAQCMAGTVLQPGSSVGVNTIINTSASIDHDSVIGDHVHIAPGCVLSGGVYVGNGTHLGTGCTVIQGIRIGSNVLVGAGAVVVRDVADMTQVRGIPARPVP